MSFANYKTYTQARVGLGARGAGLPTKVWLDFSFAHAVAADAVKMPWEISSAEKSLQSLGLSTCILSSAVADREEYLLRPDKGRNLSEASLKELSALGAFKYESLLIVVTNGLASLAINNHLMPFLEELKSGLSISLTHEKIFLVANARVALLDVIGEMLRPTVGLIIVGERPGLSSPDSLGLYLTYVPQKGRTDADRNCISNIRPPHGLGYKEGAFKTRWLIHECLRRKLSGVLLKDESYFLSLQGRGPSLLQGGKEPPIDGHSMKR